jgi:hypothetical protein
LQRVIRSQRRTLIVRMGVELDDTHTAADVDFSILWEWNVSGGGRALSVVLSVAIDYSLGDIEQVFLDDVGLIADWQRRVPWARH